MAISEAWLEPYLPASGDTFVDVGANHGEWVRRLRAQFRRVFVVEPNPLCSSELRGLGPNVVVWPVGAWDTPGWRDFTIYEIDAHTSACGAGSGINAGAALGTARYWCHTLDTMPLSVGVDFIKIDTEGAEVHVLLGALNILERQHSRMIIEVHTAANAVEVGALLQGYGYRLTEVRHPLYAGGDPLRDEHYWLVCVPN